MMPAQTIPRPASLPAGAREEALPPDITTVEYWSGACACATVWVFFLLYAALQGLGR